MRLDCHSNRLPSGGSTRRVHAATLIRLGAAAVVLFTLAAMAERARSQGTPFQQMQPMSIPAPPGSVDATQAQSADTAAAEGDAASGWSFPLVDRIAAGGWLMLPLGICSLVVFSLTLERLISLRRGRVIPRPFVRRFTECVEDGQLSFEEASQICEEFDCPVAEVFQAAVKRWGRPMMEIEQAVMDAGDRVADGLTRFLRVFHAISNVAPLIGLLGTVLGMIEAFETMSGGGAVGADLLASGISTALVTTAGGLSVAIPAYVAYMYFSAVSDRYLNEIDRLCQRVIDCISAEGLEATSRAKKPKRAA
jgi:biopolymer transport protein ExbB